tara:strand:- start:728 stop:2194 length:1467 start_codon:yes stop_codon:yes gene_type:complete
MTNAQSEALKVLKDQLTDERISRDKNAFKTQVDEAIAKSQEEVRAELTTTKDDIIKSFDEKFDKLLALQDKTEEFESKVQYNEEITDDISKGTIALQKMLYTPAKEQDGIAELAQTLQPKHDACILMGLRKGVKDLRELSYYRKWFTDNSELKKAIDPGTAGSGAEWLMTNMSANFIERMEAEYEVVNHIEPKIIIPKGIRSQDIPGAGAGFEVTLLSSTDSAGGNSTTGSTPGSRKITLTPVKFAGRIDVEEEELEDAVIDIIAQVTMPELYQSMTRGIEKAILDGDTAGTHRDHHANSPVAAGDRRKAWNGLRKLANDASAELDLLNADIAINSTSNDLASLFNLMRNGDSKYNQRNDLRLVFSDAAYWNLFKSSSLLTMDVFGGKAIVLTGELPEVMGVPIIVTSQQREDLAAVGTYDDTTTDRTVVTAFNRKSVAFAIKREATVKSDLEIEKDRRRFVITLRADFKNKYADNEPIAASLINVNT